jgi:hypothetical protein
LADLDAAPSARLVHRAVIELGLSPAATDIFVEKAKHLWITTIG